MSEFITSVNAMLRTELQTLEEERNMALERVAALEAVLAEPDEGETRRLVQLMQEAWNRSPRRHGRPGVVADQVRAILAHLRQRAGVTSAN